MSESDEFELGQDLLNLQEPQLESTRSPSDLVHLVARIQPQRLLTLLRGTGFRDVGYRENSYVRLTHSEDTRTKGTSVIVPLDPTASDFEELMATALDLLRTDWPNAWHRSIEPLLGTEAADVFDFRKETSAPRGLIPWNDGRELIESARYTLVAGAKAYLEPARQFSNRFGQFANRYLDQVLMGQSGVGSYIITAMAPITARIPIRKSNDATLGYDGIDEVSAREISSSVINSLEGASEALDHFKNLGSMTGFEENVNRGVSYELLRALRDISAGSDESDITVKIASAEGTLFQDIEPVIHQFRFTAIDTPVFERASVQLSSPPRQEKERIAVEGRVHLLTKKEVGAVGVVGVDDGNHRYRVRLSTDEEYHEAVMAHDEDRNIRVAGELSMEGTLRWLYGATLQAAGGRVGSHESSDFDQQMELGISDG